MIFYMHDAETFSNDLFYNISKCIFETEDFFFKQFNTKCVLRLRTIKIIWFLGDYQLVALFLMVFFLSFYRVERHTEKSSWI